MVATIRHTLLNLLAFYVHMRHVNPKRQHRSYEDDGQHSLPILVRTEATWNQGDPDFQYNYRSPLLKTWMGIKARCFDPANENYDLYGGSPHVGPLFEQCYSGIKPFCYDVVAYLNFCCMVEVVLGRPPAKLWSLDRISNTKGYTPQNLRWASPETQQNNRGDYKYLYAEKPTFRMPHVNAKNNPSPRLPMRSSASSLRFKSTNSKFHRMIRLLLTRPARHATGGRHRRRARESAFVRHILGKLLSNSNTKTVRRTLSCYTTHATKEHVIKPRESNRRRLTGAKE